MGNLEILNKIIAMFLTFILLYAARFCRKRTGTWLNPSSIFNIAWFMYVFVPLIVAFNIPCQVFSILYIVCFNLLFSASVILFSWKREKKILRRRFNFKLRYIILYISCFIGLYSIFSSFLIHKISLSQVFHNPLRTSGEYIALQYASAESSYVFQIGFLFSYLASFIGGNLYFFSKKNSIVLYSLFPVFSIMLFQNSKGMFFLGVAFFIGSYFVTKIIYGELKFELKFFLVFKSLFFLIFLFFVLSIVFISRGRLDSSFGDQMEYLYGSFISYSCGHLYAFSDWFSSKYLNYSLYQYNVPNEKMVGVYTFMSVYKLLGYNLNIPLGIYDEYFQYHALTTNIYTVFRGLLQDFGFVGSLVFSLCFGFFSNLIFRKILLQKYNSFCIVYYVAFIGIVYQSFLISMFVWGVCLLLFFSMWLFLKIEVMVIGAAYEYNYIPPNR